MLFRSDTAGMEMLAFSNVLNQYGGYLKENSPVVITGRLSIRDDKEPQIVINRARPISDFEHMPEEVQPEPKARDFHREWINGRLYLSVPAADAALVRKVRAILQMFPGGCMVGLKDQQTKQTQPIQAGITPGMLGELVNVLGAGKVFLFLPAGMPSDLMAELKKVLGEGNIAVK